MNHLGIVCILFRKVASIPIKENQMNWNKEQAILFFKKQQGGLIEIGEQKKRNVFRGTIVELNELDLCSKLLVEAELEFSTPGIDLAVTFHDDFIGLHLSLTHEQTPSQISMSHQIDYESLTLESP